MQTIELLSLVVGDYDVAIRFFVDRVGFRLLEDTPLGDGKRWVIVGPENNSGTSLLLARAANADQRARVGNQTGGRVFLFLYTDNFEADHERMSSAGVNFVEAPRDEPYGTVAVFEDLYGNRWDLIERRKPEQL